MAGLQFVGLGGSSGGGSAKINVTAGSILPGSAPDGQIYVITTSAVNEYYISTNQPVSPKKGDVWVRIAEGQRILTFSKASPYFTIGLYQTLQYDGALWQFKSGYLGTGGAWQQFAWPLPAPEVPLNQWTWAEIALASQFGLASSYFSIGDTKNMVSGGVTYPVEIVGFDHDDLSDNSGKAGITFGMKNRFETEERMNATATNLNGWGGSEFYQTTLPTLVASLPADLRAVVKKVKKLTSVGQKNATIVTTNDDFFLFSEDEVFGVETYAAVGEGTQYSLFTAVLARIKNKISTGKVTTWRLRSPTMNYVDCFCTVRESGTASANSSIQYHGIALGFCV